MNNKSTKNVPSLISRDASTAIKGLLMLLIVFAHTGMLNTNLLTGESTLLHDWLYTFHVHIFLILPFIYGYTNKNTDMVKSNGGGYKFIDFQCVKLDFKHNLVKIGVPYVWFFVFYTLVFVLFGHGKFNLIGLAYAFLFGGQSLMLENTGFILLWFLPAILALTTLKSVWYNSSPIVRIIMLSISIIFWILNIIRIVEMDEMSRVLPFGFAYGFYYLLLGLMTRWLVEKYSPGKMMIWVIPSIIVLTWLFAIRFELAFNPFWIVRLLMPILIFIVLFALVKPLSKSRLLLFLGKYSLQIYLLHVFIINVLKTVFLHFIQPSIGLGIVIYILSLAISAGLSVLFLKIPIVNKVVFPKG